MFIAMNRFRIATGHEGDFEELWRRRDSYLDDVEGFRDPDRAFQKGYPRYQLRSCNRPSRPPEQS